MALLHSVFFLQFVLLPVFNMMSDEDLVECKIDDEDEDDEEMSLYPSPHPLPPPQFSSSSTLSVTPQPSLTHVDLRDPYGVNKHLKVKAKTCCENRTSEKSGLHTLM